MPTMPTINLNGSDPTSLAEQYSRAYLAVGLAVEALSGIVHPRDYQLDPTTYATARDEMHSRIKAMNTIGHELLAIIEHCVEASDR